MTFGEKLKAYRQQYQLTQEELAHKLGTSKQVISRYENDQRSPKLSIAQKYAKLLGVAEGTWLSMDMNELLAGLDLKAADLDSLVSQTSLTLTDKDSAYKTVTDLVSGIYSAFSDDSFKKVTGGYATTLDMSQEGVNMKMTLTLTTDAKDAVTGYKLDMTADTDLTAAMTAEEKAQLAASGLDLSKLTVTLTTGVDSANKNTMAMTIAMGELFTMDLTADMAYTATDKTPETTIPAGSTVVDFLQLAGMAA